MLQGIPNKSHGGIFMTNYFSSLPSLQCNQNWMELQFVIISENPMQQMKITFNINVTSYSRITLEVTVILEQCGSSEYAV